MTLDHLHLLNLKLWITKLRECFERLCIPRIRPLELVRAVEWYNSFLLLLWGWKLLHEEFSSYSDGDQKPWFHDVLFQLFYSSLEAPSLFHVPMNGGWGRRGGRGRTPGPSVPRKFLTGTVSLGWLPMSQGVIRPVLGFQDPHLGLLAWIYLIISIWVPPFLRPLALPSPAPITLFHYFCTH